MLMYLQYVRVQHVLKLYFVFVRYDVDDIKSKMFCKNNTQEQSILVLYQVPGMTLYARSCCFLLCGLIKNTKLVQSQTAAQSTETDVQPLRSYFLWDSHHLLLG